MPARTLEDRERQTYAVVLEGQRKTMDWWFSYLAIVTAIIGIGGVALPLFPGIKDREELKQLRQDFREQGFCRNLKIAWALNRSELQKTPVWSRVW